MPVRAVPPTAQDPLADAFCLVCLAVEEVDHLSLAKNRRHTYLRRPVEEAAAVIAAAADAGAAAGAEAKAEAATAAAAARGWIVEQVNP
jgi:hypothetical protein